MTVSTHVYSAVLTGSPDVALDVRGGNVMLDTLRAPSVTASLEISLPDQATLTALDPAGTKRVKVTVSNSSPSFDTVTRSFDLALRERQVRHEQGVVSLSLASDEALLRDYSTMADDLTPLNYQSSLRSVINYVLNKALPGKSLAASPSNDAVMTVFSGAVNLFPDPRVIELTSYPAVNCTGAIDTTYPGAQDGVGHQGIYLYAPTGSDSRASIGGDTGAVRLGMQAGKTYVFSMNGSVRSALSGSIDSNVRRIVVYYRVGSGSYESRASPQIPATVNASTRVSVEFTLPEGVTEAFVRVYLGATTGAVSWALPRLTEKGPAGADNTSYFWGGKPDTSEYLYDWQGTADGSASRRTPLIDRAPELLIWKAGDSAMEFLTPIFQYAGYRLICDESRVWTLRSETYQAGGSLSIRHGVNLIDGTDSISRDSGLWYDAAVVKYAWRDAQNVPQEAVDAYSLTSSFTRVYTTDKKAPYPGPGYAAYLVRRSQGRKREVTATCVANWMAQAEQRITVVLSGAPTQIGLTNSVRFDLDRDEMTVNTRAQDNPPGSVNLMSGTVNALSGSINSQ